MLPVTVTPENMLAPNKERKLNELAEAKSPEYIDYTLTKFLKSFGDDQCSLELLLYFGKHPITKFSQAVVFGALGSFRADIERSLKRLLRKNLVALCIENGVDLFYLTKDEYVRSMVTGIAGLDRPQWNQLLKQVEKEYSAA
jgi:hypothetical protein